MKEYKIGEVARLLGLTTQALRFYEQEGVVTPRKSENGTRYYSVEDIVCLLAFRKYRLSEFSIHDVAAHFEKGSLNSLIDQLDARYDAMIAKSRILLKRADAICRFKHMLCEAQTKLDELLCIMRPELYLNKQSLHQLDCSNDSQREEFNILADILPDSIICFTGSADMRTVPECRFAITRETAENWQIPLENMIRLPSDRCICVHMRVPSHTWNTDYLQSLLCRMDSRGYTIRHDQPIIVRHLALEIVARTPYYYGVAYIPIL